MEITPRISQLRCYEYKSRSLLWTFRALRREFFGFRFDYPIEAIQEAGPIDSLHYYVYSDQLFLEDLLFDHDGIAMKQYRAQGGTVQSSVHCVVGSCQLGAVFKNDRGGLSEKILAPSRMAQVERSDASRSVRLTR
jgi:hypothetical protein